MQRWLPVLLPLAAAAFLSPFLAGRRILAGFDHLAYWHPLMTYAQAGWSETGCLPQWIDRVFCGLPLGESLGPSLYYPTDLLCWSLGIPVRWFYGADAAIHLALAGLGAARLAGGAGLAVPSRIMAGFAYMFGGYLLCQLNTGTVVFIRGAAWLPWIFHAAGLAARTGSLRWWLATGALLSLLPVAAGHQLLAYLSVLLPFYVGALAPSGRRTGAILRLFFAGALAIALAAVAVLPSARYFFHSMRAAATADWAALDPFLPEELAEFLARNIWGPNPRTKYPGFFVLLFAGLGTIRNWRLARLWFCLGMAGLVLAFGPDLPPGAILGRLPLWKGLRVPSHWIVIFGLATAILCAIGFEELLRDRRAALRRIGLAGLIAGILFGGLGLAHRGIWPLLAEADWVKKRMESHRLGREEIRSAFGTALGMSSGRGLVAAGTALALLSPALGPAAAPFGAVAAFGALAVADLLWTRGPNSLTPSDLAAHDPAGSLLVRTLRSKPGPFRVASDESHILVNMRIPAGLEWLSGYHGAPLDRFARLYDRVSVSPAVTGVFASLNVRYYILADTERFPSLVPLARFVSDDLKRYWLCEDPAVLPRVFFASDLKTVASPDDLLHELASRKRAGRSALVVASEAPSSRPSGRLGSGGISSVVRGYDSVEAEVDADAPSLVVFSEAFYPAWSAFVDGERRRIVPVNLLLRGVFVEAGRHRITMLYDSIPFKIGLWLSILAWSGLAGVLACFAPGWIRCRYTCPTSGGSLSRIAT